MNWTHGLFQVEEDGDEKEADADEDEQREERDDNERPLLERADRVQRCLTGTHALAAKLTNR
ncbi:uncharacterized protein LOC143175299 [Nomia melanderi]|uniref:uncharacterized protein LOC143175299 n=1 Tax=Nomia melanderi TaxID=2448451 RepID=UPI003FCD40C2